MSNPRPFHESIVEALRLARHEKDLQCLLQLIGMTKIPVNHDEILRAMCDACERFGFTGPDDLSKGSLLAQKREAAAKQKRGCLTENECNPNLLRFLPVDRQAHVRDCLSCLALTCEILPLQNGTWWTEAAGRCSRDMSYKTS